MSFEWFIARRYLTARRKQAFISLISAVSILGITVGVMACLIALALMTGVQGELRDRIVGSTAHVYVYKLTPGGYEDIDEAARQMAIEGVRGVAPAILGQGLALSERGETPLTLKGIDPAREKRVTDIDASMKKGALDALTNRPADAREGIVLGRDLATKLGVTVGDSVRILTPEGTMTPAGVVNTPHRLEVVGIFEFGFFEVDSGYGLVTLETAERLLGHAGPDLMQIKLADLNTAPRVSAALQERLGAGYQVTDWTELNKSLYSALWLEKVAIGLTIGLIVLVAALNIVASLVLLVMEKTRDIAILRTMGATAGTIRRIFILQGLTIGVVGTAAGAGLGLLACWIENRYHVIKMPPDVYNIPYLPFRLLPLDFTIVVLGAVVISLLATIYPSRQAGRLDPAEALRYE